MPRKSHLRNPRPKNLYLESDLIDDGEAYATTRKQNFSEMAAEVIEEKMDAVGFERPSRQVTKEVAFPPAVQPESTSIAA